MEKEAWKGEKGKERERENERESAPEIRTAFGNKKIRRAKR